MYRRMLDHFHITERPLPGDRDRLYRLVRANTPELRAAVEKVVAEFWLTMKNQHGVTLIQKRALASIKMYKKLVSELRVRGRKGGRPKGLREKKTRLVSETSVVSHRNQNPESITHKSESDQSSSRSRGRKATTTAKSADLSDPEKLKAEYLAKCEGDATALDQISFAIDVILSRKQGPVSAPLKWLDKAIRNFFDDPNDRELLIQRTRARVGGQVIQ